MAAKKPILEAYNKRASYYVAAFVIVSLIFGTIYTATQQLLRQDANDPQIQMAEDDASYLLNGDQPASLTTGSVNMNQSLSPFTIFYSKQGKVVSGNGYYNGVVPTIPIGVLENSKLKPFNAITWQIKPGLRFATVTVNTNKYYILAGRSLNQVEDRENTMLQISAAGWLASMVVLVGLYLLNEIY